MNIKQLLPLLAVLALLWACGSRTPQPTLDTTPPTGWEVLNRANYRIMYPANYEIDTSGLMGSECLIYAPLDSAGDRFRENVGLIVQDVQGMSLAEYVQLSELQIKSLISNAQLLESVTINPGPQEYQRLVYTGTQGVFNFKYQQHLRVDHGKAYVLSFVAETTKFDHYQHIAQQIMESLILK